MIYIYDILLNFNESFYEFYEWEKQDNILHIKRIPVFKIKTSMMEDLLSNKISFKENFCKLIENKTEVFDRKIKVLKYTCLFTDTYQVVGVFINDDYTLSKISDLLLDEEEDTINISSRCHFLEIEYNIIESKVINLFFTRKEITIKKEIENELKKIYKEKDNLKLKYLYFEYFNKLENDIEKMYQDLIYSLKDQVTNKHFKLYELLSLCNGKKSISNLTN